jgi:DDE_Tnp_1-associated
MSLSELFKSFPDFRRGQGQRYPLEDVLWMIFLGVCSGYSGYRPVGKFAKANTAFFTESLALKHGIPSHVTFREILMHLDKQAVKERFAEWCASQDLSEYDWVSGDGKSLKSTLSDYDAKTQDFCAIVSIYVQKTGLCYLIEDFRNKKIGEAEILRILLPSLQDKGVILTLDALHTQKKR